MELLGNYNFIIFNLLAWPWAPQEGFCKGHLKRKWVWSLPVTKASHQKYWNKNEQIPKVGGGGKNHSKNASICLVLLFTIGSKLDKLAERGWSLILSNSATKSTSPPKMVLLVGTLACLPASQQLERCERAKNARLRVFPGVVWAGASTCSNDSKECRKHQQNHGIFNELKWPMKKTCCLGYIGGYITQLCGVLLYSKSLEDSYIKQPALMHGKWESFFFVAQMPPTLTRESLVSPFTTHLLQSLSHPACPLGRSTIHLRILGRWVYQHETDEIVYYTPRGPNPFKHPLWKRNEL